MTRFSDVVIASDATSYWLKYTGRHACLTSMCWTQTYLYAEPYLGNYLPGANCVEGAPLVLSNVPQETCVLYFFFFIMQNLTENLKQSLPGF